jgi:hypothetical protein
VRERERERERGKFQEPESAGNWRVGLNQCLDWEELAFVSLKDLRLFVKALKP